MIAASIATADEPQLKRCYCSQCGNFIGMGTRGFSHCEDHPRGLLGQIKPVNKTNDQPRKGAL